MTRIATLQHQLLTIDVKQAVDRHEDHHPHAHPFPTDQTYIIELAKVTNQLLVEILEELSAMKYGEDK